MNVSISDTHCFFYFRFYNITSMKEDRWKRDLIDQSYV